MKELPYFKFFPGEWMKGDITVCSKKAQGLFINICAYYWSKECNITLTQVQRRFNDCLTELEELINDKIILVEDDKLFIDFLDEQFEQFAEIRKQQSRAGKASAKKRKVNARSTGVQRASNHKDKDKEEDKDKEIYRSFDHLSITVEQFKKLEQFWRKETIDGILDRIENYKDNKKYKSLYLTAKNWIKDEPQRGRVWNKLERSPRKQ